MSRKKSKVGIRIYMNDKELENVVKEIVVNLTVNVAKELEKPELANAEILENLDQRVDKTLLIVDNIEFLDSLNKKDVDKILFFVEKSVPSSVIDKLLDFPIAGVFSKKNFTVEYEEKGRFEAKVKETIRELIMEDSNEKDLRKRIDWKYKDVMSKKKEGKIKEKFVSLFLDPSMQKTAEKIRYIVSELKRIYKEIEMVEVLKERLEILKKWKSSNKHNWNDFKKIEEKFKDRGFRVVPSILIEGPTGSGKSLLARIIAESLFETARRFIKELDFNEFFSRVSVLNVEEWVETELFGSSEGSYTDAKDYPGIFLSKAGGVVFLDEIAEIDSKTQAKLLLYLDDWRVRPVGLLETFLAPTVVIAATNKDLLEAIDKKLFRADLYRRFLFRIKLPSLNERKSDFRLLISFVLTTSPHNTGEVEYISLKAIEKLEKHDYPGNFRELEEILNNALIKAKMAKRNIILERDLEI
ncbi:sigma-54 dependent transcriptional regulator [Thermotoga sp. KOL6]|uniref:sigma-54-dependent transcriptional regulator n=1 Tax=Thermotoga sp. KOL6 TaxID=126741 RepID=UPI000C75964B|nr:sigma 54-interacting transcriptional regulator [Thermotoga sp. KOL6]PLV58070.1 hypothetical protein AS005_08665 [Thermotoga sp. KOL6]